MIISMFYNDVPPRTIGHSVKCVVITMDLKHDHMLQRTGLLTKAQVRGGLLTEAQVRVSKAVNNPVLRST